MNCEKIQRKLSAYLDGELSEPEKQHISEHLETCQNCKQELALFSEQDEFIRKLEVIEPSVNFRARFWQKVNTSLSHTIWAGINPAPTRPVWGEGAFVFRWIPVPIGLSILIFLFLSFSILSPVFSEDKEIGQAVLTLAKNTLLPTPKSKIIAPLNFANFCDQYCQIICEKNQKMGSGCNYQGCKMK